MKMLGRLCAVGLLLSACDASQRRDASEGPEQVRSSLQRVTTPSAADVPALAAGNGAFAFEVLHQLAANELGKNLVFSPYSISTALGMTYAGARADTQAEMKRALHFELEQPALHEAFNHVDQALARRGDGKVGADQTPFKLNVNNALWQQRGFPLEPTFLDTLALHYGAGVFVTDFRTQPEPSRMTINDWVAEQTEQLIPELLPADSITSLTALVLTNTVYLNASWQTKFEKEQTRDAPFQRADGSTVQVPMMNAGLMGGVAYAKGTDYEAVALPYAGDELAFIAVLPEGDRYATVEQSADVAWFTQLQAQLAPSSVQLSLPKLDTRTATSLRAPLEALGMKQAFEGGADFSGMTSQRVFIDDVIHEAVLQVFEEGTIAAAATAVVIRAGSVPKYDHVVRFDRPFLYAIVDRPTGQILFLGRVLDPSAG